MALLKPSEGRRSRPREDKDSGSMVWLTVYSDLMTNLMLFFLMLFAFTRLQTQLREDLSVALKEQFSGKKVERRIDEGKQQIEEIKKVAFVEETLTQIKISLPAPVLFDIGKAELKRETLKVLSDVTKPLKDSKYPIVVEGHTDSLPIYGGKYRSNWHLSAARAFAVLNYLSEVERIDPKRLSSLGYGEFRPVAPNDTEENRAKNRRIDIILVKR